MRLADNRISEGLNSPAILGTFCGRKSVIWSIGARPGWTGHPSGARAGPHRPQQREWVPIPYRLLAGRPGRRDPPPIDATGSTSAVPGRRRGPCPHQCRRGPRFPVVLMGWHPCAARPGQPAAQGCTYSKQYYLEHVCLCSAVACAWIAAGPSGDRLGVLLLQGPGRNLVLTDVYTRQHFVPNVILQRSGQGPRECPILRFAL